MQLYKMKAVIVLYFVLLAQQLHADIDLPSQSVTSGQETEDEKSVLNSATCYLACIEEMELDTVLQLSNTGYSAWPSYVLETNTNTTDCQRIRSFLECHRGCVISNTTKLETSCNSKCNLTCNECSLGSQACKNLGCNETVHRNVTECVFWCNFLHSANFTMCSNETGLAPSPINAPNLEMYIVSGQSGLYKVNLTDSAPITTNVSSLRPTSFIFRVEIISTGTQNYIWQKPPSNVLSLVEFSGQNVSITFAVVTRCGRSQYSPSVNVLLGDPPSKIRNISVVSYSWVSASSLLHVELSWDPPAVVNGVLRGYNVSIGTRPLEELEEPVGDFHITDITPSASTNSSVSLSTILNFPDVQCLYIQMRAWNDFGPGKWSKELLVVTSVNQERFQSDCYWDVPPSRFHLVWYDLETTQCGRSDFITQVEIHRLLLDTSGSVNQELSVISQIAFDNVERSFDDLDATQNYELIFVANFVEPSVNIHTLGSCNVQAAISPPTTTSFPTSTLLPLPISLPSPPSLFTSTHYISSHISMASARPLLPSPVISDSSHQRSALLTVASSTSFSLYSSYILIPSPTTNIPPTILLSSLAAPLTLPSLSYTPPSGTQTRPTPTGMPSAPPSKIHNVSVTSYSWDSAASLLHVDLSWDPPAVVNGVLRGYNVSIGTRPLEELEEPVGDFHITDITPSASPNSSASFSAALNFTGTQCLYVQMRAWNDFEPGQWSNYLLVVTSVNQERFESFCYWDDPPSRLHLIWYDLETTQCGRSDFITQVEIHRLLLDTSGSVNQELDVITQKAFQNLTQDHWDDLNSTQNYGFVFVANFIEPAVNALTFGSCNVTAASTQPTTTFFPTSTLLPSQSMATSSQSIPTTYLFLATSLPLSLIHSVSPSQTSLLLPSRPTTSQSPTNLPSTSSMLSVSATISTTVPMDTLKVTLPEYVFGVIGGGIVAAAAAVVIAVTVLIVCKLHKRKRQLQRITEDFSVDLMFRNGPRHESAECVPLQADEWEIPPQQVIVDDQCLGEGAFGEVYKGTVIGPLSSLKVRRLMKTNLCITVAIKLLKPSARGSERSDFLEEIETMKKVAEGRNPHVVGLVGCVTIQEPLCLITEFVEYGDLLSYLRTSRKQTTQGLNKLLNNPDNPYYQLGRVTAADLVSFAYQIASGMEFLSSLGIVHRDLACRNVLVAEGKVLKITDFGMAREIDEVYVQKSKGRVPLKWMAIESIVEREFTTASDVWAYGVTLWEIATMGGYPYPCIMCEDILQQLQSGHRMEKPDNCVPEVYHIMLECWDKHPEKRPSFAQIRAKFDTMLVAGGRDTYIDLQFDSDKPYYKMDPETPSLICASPQINHLCVDTEPLQRSSQEPSSPQASPAQSCRTSVHKASGLSRSLSPIPTDKKPWRPSSMILAEREHRENKYVAEPLSGATEGGPEMTPFELYARQSEQGSSNESYAGPFSLPVHITITEDL